MSALRRHRARLLAAKRAELLQKDSASYDELSRFYQEFQFNLRMPTSLKQLIEQFRK